MKRQVAITGPTPEFLRWSIRQGCLLRRDTQIDSVDQTEKRLRAVRTAGSAIGSQRTLDGIAVRKIQDAWKGFRLQEIFQIFGGQTAVESSCASCPANVTADEIQLAGCFGWLPRVIEKHDLAETLEQSISESQKQHVQESFLNTQPAWYGLWADGNLDGNRLGVVLELLEQHLRSETAPDMQRLIVALNACVKHQLTLDVELVPPGHSDGLRWTISPHCERCKAVAMKGQTVCRVCRKAGRGHPQIHRRVLGLRPWIDLAVVVGEQNVHSFLERFSLKNEET